MSRLAELKADRTTAEAKLRAIMAADSGYDAKVDGEDIVAATERYKNLIKWLSEEIDKEVARKPWQRRVGTRAR